MTLSPNFYYSTLSNLYVLLPDRYDQHTITTTLSNLYVLLPDRYNEHTITTNAHPRVR